MNKKILLILSFILFTGLATAEPWIEHMEITPEEPETGEQVELTAVAESNGRITFLQADWTGDDEWETEICDTFVRCERSWAFELDEPGEQEIKVRAQDADGEYSPIETETINVEDERETSVEFTEFPTEFQISESHEIEAEALDSFGNLNQQDFSLEWRETGNDWEEISIEECESETEDYLETCVVDGEFTPQSTEEHEIRAQVTTSDGLELQNTRQFAPTTDDPAVQLESTSASDYILEEDGSTTLSAEVRNNRPESSFVNVQWYADDTEIGGQWQSIDAQGTGTIEKETTYSELKSRGLETEKNYDLEARLTYNDLLDTETADEQLRLVEPEELVCDITVNDLKLDPSTIIVSESSEASIDVINDGDNQDVNLEILKDGNKIYTDSDTIQSDETREFSTDISPEKGTYTIRAIVETEGDPCGTEEYHRTETLYVVEDDRDAQLNINVNDQDSNPLENANIDVNGITAHTDPDGHVKIPLESGTYQVEASKENYVSETKSVTLDHGETKTIDFELVETEVVEDKGKLTTIVQDSDSNRLEDALVVARNHDHVAKRTDEDGVAEFQLSPSEYDVTASKSSYISETKTVHIEEDDEIERTFTLSREHRDQVSIQSVGHKSEVCKGRSLLADVQIRNDASEERVVDLTARGFGEEIEQSFEIGAKETSVKEVRFTNARPLGEQELEFKIDNHDTEIERSTVNVVECPHVEPVHPTGLTAQVSPSQIFVGDTAVVRGYVDGVRGSTEVEVKVDGRTATRTDTRRDGFYQAYIRPNRVGDRTVEVIAGDISRTRSIEVLPTANIDFLDAPNRVFEGEEFEVCANVETQRTARVLLVREGEIIQSKDTSGETCFETEAFKTGKQNYEIRALTGGRDASASKNIEVLEQGNEVESFPGQVASVRSGDSVVKVDLYNTGDQLREYDLELEGLPDTWLSQSTRTVRLPQGDRKTVYFYLTPRDEGEFRPNMNVEADGELIYSDDVVVEVGGSDVREKRTVWQRFRGFLSL